MMSTAHAAYTATVGACTHVFEFTRNYKPTFRSPPDGVELISCCSRTYFAVVLSPIGAHPVTCIGCLLYLAR